MMAEHKIIIPETVEYTRPLVCLIDPVTNDAEISLTLEGEDTPFRTAELKKRSNEIAVFVFRPRTLDVVNKKFTEPLKKGDIINVKVVADVNSKEPTIINQKVNVV